MNGELGDNQDLDVLIGNARFVEELQDCAKSFSRARRDVRRPFDGGNGGWRKLPGFTNQKQRQIDP
ncbi:hypothetical protein M433DRAFT_10688 [Acidomyces richmondensis BFW]|nr:hypothetical protein M433DRAFT_10688 [Acidomyces richmondensis BFW]